MTPRRILELDGLRGLAALAVLLFHYTVRYDQLFAPRRETGIRFTVGECGVMLFFMISGVVILLTLERSGSALDFCWNRVTRLYPAYWAAILATMLVVHSVGPAQLAVGWRDAAFNLTMLQGLLGASHVDGVYWSLEVELVFYATILLVWKVLGPAHLAATVVATLALSLLAHFGIPALPPVLANSASGLSTRIGLPYLHLFALGVGMYLWRFQGRKRVGAAIVAGAIVAHTWEHGGQEGVIIVVLAVSLWLALNGRFTILAAAPLVMLGNISYALYLTHQNIGYCVLHALGNTGCNTHLATAVATVVSLLVAGALTYGVERPALAWLRTRARSKRLLPTTDTLLSAMAAAAATGGRAKPIGASTPAASGNSSKL